LKRVLRVKHVATLLSHSPLHVYIVLHAQQMTLVWTYVN